MMDKNKLDSILFGGSSGTSSAGATPTTGKMDKSQVNDILFSKAGVSATPPATGFGAISAQDYASKTKEKLSWWEQVKQGADNFKESFYEAQPEPLQAVMRGADAVGNAGQKLVKGAATMATGMVRGIGRAAVGTAKSTVANTIGYAQEALTGDDSIREAALAPVNIPFLGNVKGYSANPEDVEKYGAATAEATAGDALEAAEDAVSLYSGGMLSPRTAKTFGGAVGKAMGVGGLFGFTNGVARAMQNDENLEDVITNGLFSGGISAITSGLFGAATNLDKLKSPGMAAKMTGRKDLLDEYKRVTEDPERAARIGKAVEAGDLSESQRGVGEQIYKKAKALEAKANADWQKTELGILREHADDLVGKKSVVPSINYGIRSALSDEAVKVSEKGVLNFDGSKLQGTSNKAMQKDLQDLVNDMMKEPKNVADLVYRRDAINGLGEKFSKDKNAYRIYKTLVDAYDASLDKRMSELGVDLAGMRANWKLTAGPAKDIANMMVDKHGQLDLDKAAAFAKTVMSTDKVTKATLVSNVDHIGGSNFLDEIKTMGAINLLDKAKPGTSAGVSAAVMTMAAKFAHGATLTWLPDLTKPDVWSKILVEQGMNTKLAESAGRRIVYDYLQVFGRQLISKVAGSLTND